MKLPSFKRLYDSDFAKESQQIVSQLAVTINQGFEVLYNALNKRLTFEDNFQCTVKNVTVIVNSSGIPTPSVSFNLDTIVANLSVTGLIVVDVENLTNPSGYPTSGVTVSWTQTQSGVSINHVTGLIPNNTYQLRVIAFN